MKQASTGLVSCCNSSLECFMSIFLASHFSLFLQFTSFESSLLFTLTSLRSSLVFSSALARLWLFTGAPVFFRFQFVPIKLLKLAPGFDLAPFRNYPSESWRIITSSHRGLTISTYCLPFWKTKHYEGWRLKLFKVFGPLCVSINMFAWGFCSFIFCCILNDSFFEKTENLFF